METECADWFELERREEYEAVIFRFPVADSEISIDLYSNDRNVSNLRLWTKITEQKGEENSFKRWATKKFRGNG
jgi:hypothetical protein